jgi:hypothetical protein
MWRCPPALRPERKGGLSPPFLSPGYGLSGEPQRPSWGMLGKTVLPRAGSPPEMLPHHEGGRPDDDDHAGHELHEPRPARMARRASQPKVRLVEPVSLRISCTLSSSGGSVTCRRSSGNERRPLSDHRLRGVRCLNPSRYGLPRDEARAIRNRDNEGRPLARPPDRRRNVKRLALLSARPSAASA